MEKGGFIAFRCANFENTAEREQFRLLCKILRKQYANSNEFCLLIANYNIFDCELDSILIKKDAIIAIEFKNYGGKVIATENGEWSANGNIVKGGSRKTVYQQAKVNHIALRNGLNELGINSQWTKDIPSLIVFNQPIIFESNLSSRVHSWLHVTDNEHFIEKVSDITCKYTNISNIDMINLAISMNLSKFIDKELSDFCTTTYNNEQPFENNDSITKTNSTIPEYNCDLEKEFLSCLESYSNYTPNHIFRLRTNQIFVFGTDTIGSQKYGAAGIAAKRFGAQVGVTEGRTGNSYALPTRGFSINELTKAVERLSIYIKNNPNLTFLITPVGCGHAGFDIIKVANLFKDLLYLTNVMLPESFIKVYRNENCQRSTHISMKVEDMQNNKNEIFNHYKEHLHSVIHYLIDNKIPFKQDGEFTLFDNKGDILAKAELYIESEKIVFYPFNIQSETAFKNNGYNICTPDQYLTLKKSK